MHDLQRVFGLWTELLLNSFKHPFTPRQSLRKNLGLLTIALFSVLSFSIETHALTPSSSTIKVFGPKTYQPTKSQPAVDSFSAQLSAGQSQTTGQMMVTAGRAAPINICTSSNWWDHFMCEVTNEVSRLFLQFTRPTFLEITLNNQTIAQLKEVDLKRPEVHTFNFPLKLLASNKLQVVLRGSFFSYAQIEVQQDVSVVNLPPVALMSVSPKSGIAPEDVAFVGLASEDKDGSITSYLWDFGDGSASNQDNVNVVTHHQYQTPGRYT